MSGNQLQHDVPTTQDEMWKPLKWTNAPTKAEPAMPFECICGFCGRVPSAPIPGAKLLFAGRGGFLYFEPIDTVPGPDWVPEEIGCPRCGTAFISVTGQKEVDGQ